LRDEALSGAATRRDLLRGAVAATALGAVGWSSGAAVAATAPLGSRAGLGSAGAERVNPRHFAPAAQLRERQEALDGIGLRATGTPVHHRYVDDLARRLERVGAGGVTTEGVPLRRWQPTTWGLNVLEGEQAGPVHVAAYVPYSGRTPADGVTASLALVAPGPVDLPLAGKVAMFDVAPTPLAYAALDLNDYGTPEHPDGYNPAALYDRPWLSALQMPHRMQALRAAGAVAAIGVLDLPAEAADGSYFPYDGVIRDLPTLYVDRDVGAELRKVAIAGGKVRLTLDAEIEQVTTPNVYGFIPGRSDELVILHSHHDGTNGLEDNGPEAILAMSQYLTGLPPDSIPRTILVLLSTGHFAGGWNTLGANAFIERHRDGLVARTAAAVTVEHLGALEWLARPDGGFALTGRPEEGGFFASPFDAVIDPARAALRAARFIPDRVMRPFSPNERSPDLRAWPGDGEGFWAIAGLPAANFITGPNYLLNSGISTTDKTDFAAARRQAIAFTELVLTLGRTPLEELHRHRPECSLCREPAA
jgi:hypothetical protein